MTPACFAQETYSNPTLGFSIRKPGSWHYLTAEQHRENLKRSDFADPKFKELVTRYARTPFLAITKYKEPHDDLNPSVQVNAREASNLKGMAPREGGRAYGKRLRSDVQRLCRGRRPARDQSFRPSGRLHASELHP